MTRALVLIRMVAAVAVVLVALGLLAQAQWHGLTMLDLFWQGIVPLVPLLLLLAPDVWRQVCPVATANLAGPRLVPGPRPISPARFPAGAAHWLKRYGLPLGATLLWLLVPLRLLLLNASSQATGALVITVVLLAMMMGFLMSWKSGWCVSICPVYPVEKLYGSAPLWQTRDPRCVPESRPDACFRCALRCVDVPARDLYYWRAMDSSAPPPGVANMQEAFIGSFPGFVLAYVLLWAFARVDHPASPGIVAEVYGFFALLMLSSYRLYRFAQERARRSTDASIRALHSDRVDITSAFLALNLYYIAGASGIATVVNKLSHAGHPRVLATAIMIAVLWVSAIWLRRSWNHRLQPYAEW